MSAVRKLTLRCPECAADLVVDAETGEILFHREAEAPVAGGRDLDSLFRRMEEEKSGAESVFSRELGALKDRERLLEAKFREAMKRAREEPDDEPPPRPIDLD